MSTKTWDSPTVNRSTVAAHNQRSPAAAPTEVAISKPGACPRSASLRHGGSMGLSGQTAATRPWRESSSLMQKDALDRRRCDYPRPARNRHRHMGQTDPPPTPDHPRQVDPDRILRNITTRSFRPHHRKAPDRCSRPRQHEEGPRSAHSAHAPCAYNVLQREESGEDPEGESVQNNVTSASDVGPHQLDLEPFCTHQLDSTMPGKPPKVCAIKYS